MGLQRLGKEGESHAVLAQVTPEASMNPTWLVRTRVGQAAHCSGKTSIAGFPLRTSVRCFSWNGRGWGGGTGVCQATAPRSPGGVPAQGAGDPGQTPEVTRLKPPAHRRSITCSQRDRRDRTLTPGCVTLTKSV